MNPKLLISLTLLCSSAASAAVSFTNKPAARRDGEATHITFTVSGRTDVEVAILNHDGAVVRHLAAGVLGGAQAPPAPLKAGLSQDLLWDGKDDFAHAVPGDAGPFKLRVRAGTGVTFGRFIGAEPYLLGAPDSIAADEEGNVYVCGMEGNRNQNMRTIRVFDPAGKYLRTVMPFPADLPPDGMKDVARWDEAAGTFRPRNLSSVNPEFYAPGLHLVSASLKSGLILTDGQAVYHLDARGGVSGASLQSQALWPKGHNLPNSGGGPVLLTASPDGKYLYLSGPFSAKTQYGHVYDSKFPPGAVYRMTLGEGQTMQHFVTIDVAHPEVGEFEAKKNGPGAAWMSKAQTPGHFTVPHGAVHQTAVDRAGDVYVADREHDCVAIFDSAGKPLAQIPVKYPHLLAVHPKTGALYVMQFDCIGYHKFSKVLVRFDKPLENSAPSATFDLGPEGNWPSMALSAGAKTILWVSGVKGGVVAIEDQGAAFAPVATAYAPPADTVDVFNRIAVDADHDQVYISDGGNEFMQYDGQSGAGSLLRGADGKPFHGTDLAVGYDGLLYVRGGEGFSGPLARYTRDLKPAPYPSGSNILSNYIYGRYGIGNCEKGLGVGPDGKIYISLMNGWCEYWVAGFGADGKALPGKYLQGKVGAGIAAGKKQYPSDLTSAIIGWLPQTNGGLRVDLAGNIYVGMLYTPADAALPAGLNKDEAYRHCTGSVIKFSPEGGSTPGDPTHMVAKRIDGALAAYPGLAPFSHPSLGTTCCVCRIPRFDIDRYGRLAIPNAIADCVRLCDNSGNEILTFGRYGNFDSQYVNPNTPAGRAGKPTVAVPGIPLAWPDGAALSEKGVYVCDVYNRRVVRADFTWQAEETAVLVEK